jgi:putative nucleotidyltransferase with HDIG domain
MEKKELSDELSTNIDKHCIALIDENKKHKTEISNALSYLYKIVDINETFDIFDILRDTPPAAILIGEKTGYIGSLRFIRTLRQIPSLRRTVVIFIADRYDPDVQNAATLVGANDVLAKPYRRSTLIRMVSSHLNAQVERTWTDMPDMERQALEGTMSAFTLIADAMAGQGRVPFEVVKNSCSSLVDAVNNGRFRRVLNGIRHHDNYSYAHSLRVATLLSIFGKHARLAKSDQLTLASAGLLHDTGKMAIPHEILNKPGLLDDAERAVMRSHVPETVRYLKASHGIPGSIIAIAEQHHEKLNGQGYPHGLKGGQINELVRMAAIVDVFSALTDRRPYKPPFMAEKALSIMSEEMPGHLDMSYVRLFREILLDAATGTDLPLGPGP